MKSTKANSKLSIDFIILAIAILAISTSGPLITVTAAPAIAIAFWRCFLGAIATMPFAYKDGLKNINKKTFLTSVSAGLLLGIHFAVWIPSLRFTTVAASTAMVATQPAWAALIAKIRGESIPNKVWVGIFVALAGAILLTGIDITINSRAVIGDLLALLGAIFAALYVTVGQSAREKLTTAQYTMMAYSAAACALLVLVVVTGTNLTGYSRQAWVYIFLLTLLAQILGHTLFNITLRSLSATVVSMGILFEMPGSTIIAALAIGQLPPWQTIPAIVLLMVGMFYVVTGYKTK
ncbi:MAG: DMT family transporter [Candidatus Nanopelagicales bacterium]|jgi:drug/metabolite transporter (DMT)-like permease|nr:DMT family transporter [Candidatus Nanopelagicales bacterium]MDP4746684.1 DMT family transporter [Candidatus Nanopelagicales bacterium]MDP4986395.1 DMT family transporter [Candidatus Nanopelagicales bacterium]MDP5107439.1 DMT family transporter [Candidatus Nanopelagicales bacterium]